MLAGAFAMEPFARFRGFMVMMGEPARMGGGAWTC
jgi:hypothetical protein